jgi:hypothetical protein
MDLHERRIPPAVTDGSLGVAFVIAYFITGDRRKNPQPEPM